MQMLVLIVFLCRTEIFHYLCSIITTLEVKPKSFLLNTLKVLGGIVVGIVALLFAATWAVNSSKVQNRLMQCATKALSDRFQTRISMDSISVQFFQPSLRFYGDRKSTRLNSSH